MRGLQAVTGPAKASERTNFCTKADRKVTIVAFFYMYKKEKDTMLTVLFGYKIQIAIISI
jgi:hypothetical protein